MSINWIKIQHICDMYCITEEEYFEMLEAEAEHKLNRIKESK